MHATCPAGDSLQKLTLNDNPVLELDKDSFRGLLLLRELNISTMSHLTRIGPSTFTHLRSLEILFCSYNHNLTDIDEAAFGYVDDEWTLKEVYITQEFNNWLMVILSYYCYFIRQDRSRACICVLLPSYFEPDDRYQ